MARYIESIADPERPIPVELCCLLEMSGRKARVPAPSAAKLVAALAIVLGLTLAWNFTPLSEFLDSKSDRSDHGWICIQPLGARVCDRRRSCSAGLWLSP